MALLLPASAAKPKMLQLNDEEAEGLTAIKLLLFKQVALSTKAVVILLQETHYSSADKLVISNFTLAGSILSRKHGLVTFDNNRKR